VVRIQDIEKVLELLGVSGRCKPYSVMAPQWNIEFDDRSVQEKAVKGLQAAYIKEPGQPLFWCHEVGNTICVNLLQKLPRPIDWDANCVFPVTDRTVKMRDLAAEKDASAKQGYHEQAGVLFMAGPGVRVGASIGECSTLDIAPTLLTLLGLPVPGHMKGRVLEEALDPTVRPVRTVQPAREREPAPSNA
jgi:hypothetical protein